MDEVTMGTLGLIEKHFLASQMASVLTKIQVLTVTL